MEYEIQKHNIQIPDRPATQSPADLTAIRKAHQDSRIEEYEAEKIPQMRDEAKVRDTGPKSKRISFNNYILDRRGPHDWRDSRNPSRDYPRMAIISFIEPRLVKGYRKQLLEKSPAAAWLRGDIQSILSSYAKPRQVLKPGAKKYTTTRRYNFPDGLKNLPSKPCPVVDVGQVLLQLADARNVAEHVESLKSMVKKIEALPYAAARPDVTLLAPNVKTNIDGLFKVRRTITLFYRTQISVSQALNDNLHSLSAMRSQDLDMVLVDPLDDKWKVKVEDATLPRKGVWTADCVSPLAILSLLTNDCLPHQFRKRPSQHDPHKRSIEHGKKRSHVRKQPPKQQRKWNPTTTSNLRTTSNPRTTRNPRAHQNQNQNQNQRTPTPNPSSTLLTSHPQTQATPRTRLPPLQSLRQLHREISSRIRAGRNRSNRAEFLLALRLL
jgi:hypothetical protein